MGTRCPSWTTSTTQPWRVRLPSIVYVGIRRLQGQGRAAARRSEAPCNTRSSAVVTSGSVGSGRCRVDSRSPTRRLACTWDNVPVGPWLAYLLSLSTARSLHRPTPRCQYVWGPICAEMYEIARDGGRWERRRIWWYGCADNQLGRFSAGGGLGGDGRWPWPWQGRGRAVTRGAPPNRQNSGV